MLNSKSYSRHIKVDQEHVSKYSSKPETNFYKYIHIIFIRNMQEKMHIIRVPL